jgi:hypothetical protein
MKSNKRPYATTENEVRRHERRPRFALGQVLATPGALTALLVYSQHPLDLLQRYVTGDWGDLDDEDKAANAEALEQGLRLVSAYTLEDGTRLWIITEHDRSVTTLLLPSEY